MHPCVCSWTLRKAAFLGCGEWPPVRASCQDLVHEFIRPLIAPNQGCHLPPNFRPLNTQDQYSNWPHHIQRLKGVRLLGHARAGSQAHPPWRSAPPHPSWPKMTSSEGQAGGGAPPPPRRSEIRGRGGGQSDCWCDLWRLSGTG